MSHCSQKSDRDMLVFQWEDISPNAMIPVLFDKSKPPARPSSRRTLLYGRSMGSSEGSGGLAMHVATVVTVVSAPRPAIHHMTHMAVTSPTCFLRLCNGSPPSI